MNDSDFDLAVGVGGDAVNSGLQKAYQQHRDAFRGSVTPPPIEGTTYTFAWDFLTAPSLVLAPPDADLWAKMIKADGITDLPDSGVLQFVTEKLQADCKVGDTALPQVTPKVTVALQLKLDGGGITVVPLGAFLDKLPADPTSIIVKNVVVPTLLTKGADLLKGLKIPAQDLFGQTVTLNLVRVDVIPTHLVLASTAKVGRPSAVRAAPADWPTDKQVFTLISKGLLTTLLTAAVKKYENTQLAKDDKTIRFVASARWDATFRRAKDLKVGSDPTTASAGVDIDWHAELDLVPITPDGKGGCALSKAGHDT
ncbi:hypothetical protein IPZ58_10965 [Streptomyces roseoverticillatus]|uniref:hypothetical protein n=1 Tax=Streptomyces roseoverticillatus TaxID=66429 RepID=UPI001F20EE73|nr:hypothetical protein [Streptomyces roseoverticillatus]MCF3102105.1 hypothetical protein [Streptomyces roseoverticillatus]